MHINSPIPDHGQQAIQALKAGKHVACTGILAHESAMKGGEIVRLPEWTHR